ncbi:MAG: cytochrome c oxidase subunit II [Cyanobacteria bacterium]|nr:cytochrome c oxidase subunit II [Cyanobacteria bacterium CG_2015-16_32_12]NCO76707.1 cytochrome c oxidase subunit II [Cyanobacteria bacterium CG_2015-22_32_23]NCQ04775.1 cytochrome c oxidase subunit II [Cyanobacteria bacterium CG_2015-09_32_10]NCS84705.1 cytochrome c oxidase subunit II [Cyanobacteria bacterium CG_2015-02_32_10]
MNIPGNIITLIAGILLTLISLWYGQNHGLMPIEASQGAAEVDDLFNLMMTIATGLFLIVQGVLVYSIFKFRRQKGDKTDGPGIEGNVPLEIVWTAIPTVIVFILALYSFEVYNNLGGLDSETSRDFPQEEMQMAENQNQGKMVAFNPHQGHLSLGIGNANADIEVDVNGIQYAWIFTYPDSGVVSGELHVPINKQIKLNMKAGDVIHAFWVPQLRLKQDVLPGRESTFAFNANRIGDYPIICAELCGAYHGGMKTTLHVESEEDYQKWIQENTFASAQEKADTMAMMTQPMTKESRLEMHSHHLGVNSETLAQLHH